MGEAYCGPAPTPSSLLSAWNPDLVAIALCLSILIIHRMTRRDSSSFAVGAAAVLAMLFLSPLCALTAALFSARAVHHVLLVGLAAPLLALAFPVAAPGTRRIGIGWIAAIHAACFWLWHAPPVYALAIVQPALYWLMQASLLGSGLWLWRRVFDQGEPAGGVVLALLGTTVQMGMLGALLTFAASPLYEPHMATTLPFGLTPLQDQQLAGLVMWVPAALPYIAAAIHRALPLLGPSAGPILPPR